MVLTSIKKEGVWNKELEFYDYQNEKAGMKISGEITLDKDCFLASLPNSDEYLSLIETSLDYRYRYHYEANEYL